jgi:site-specific recombinase XerD
METGLTTTSTMGLDLFDARKYVKASKAHNTQRAYNAAWKEFTTFCDERGLCALPASPDAVIAYATWLAEKGIRPATIQVKLAGISFAHRTAHQQDPTGAEDVKVVMAGIRRELGTAPSKKAPVTLDDLCLMVATIDTTTLSGKRDKALLLLGWAGAFRRSELVALDMADLQINGAVKVKVIPPIDDLALDPVRALRSWLDAAGITSGAVFRKVSKGDVVSEARLTSQSVALIVKDLAKRAKLDWRSMAGHSLRSGFVTQCAMAGVESRDIMAQTGHKSEAVMRGYIQDAGRGAMGAVRAAFGQVTEGESSKLKTLAVAARIFSWDFHKAPV